ncbi:MAG: amidophosphoribosyltransferase [Hominilimicola sp.]
MLKDSRIGEECGVFAIYDPEGDCARSTYYGLYALQHRGQESCGIAVNNNRDITHYKDMGLVNDVFNDEILTKLNGTMAVGHVRYSTTGESMRENAQPLVLRYSKGNIAIAHNGNLVNKDDLAKELSVTGAIFQTTTDTEMIAYTIAKERLAAGSVEAAVEKTIDHLVGSFSLIVMSPQKLIAARDPWGFKPLCMGRRGNAIVFASETCALDSIGAEFVRDLEPGEIVVVKNGEIKTIRTHVGKKPHTMCIFEYLNFARPDSVIEGQSAHDSRMLAGKYLAQEYPVDADVVVGVPDSGLSAAMGYAKESGIPYGIGFVKNKYIGRTFIQPSQAMRENAVRIKLNVLRSTIEGKRVVMVDDSIVRGTTSKRIVSLLRQFGAKEVHVRSSAPPFLWPCYFGTDVPSRDQLVACNYSMEGIRELIGADSLGFLSVEALSKIIPNANCGYCDGCFSGKYPVEIK